MKNLYKHIFYEVFFTKVLSHTFLKHFLPDKIMENPWYVDTIDAFYCLKCPECVFDTKGQTIFHNHAVENHPLSFVFFEKKPENEIYVITEECKDGIKIS